MLIQNLAKLKIYENTVSKDFVFVFSVNDLSRKGRERFKKVTNDLLPFEPFLYIHLIGEKRRFLHPLIHNTLLTSSCCAFWIIELRLL